MDKGAAPDWAAVAEAYARGDLTVAEICTRYGITQYALYSRLRKQGWPRRRGLRPASSSVNAPCCGSGSAREALISRLYSALEQKMSEFEARQSDRAQTAAEHERETRTLNTMVRLFERLGALEEKSRTQNTTAKDDGDLSADARSLREDLARRLERLRAERGA
jgi:transposase-like protein